MTLAFINDAAHKAFLKLPVHIQERFKLDLHAILNGSRPFSKFKHLTDSVGAGAIELIINGSPAFRCIYCAKINDTLYILDAFEKTTNGVDLKAMRRSKKRYSLMPKK